MHNMDDRINDEKWLRDQYISGQRSMGNIAAELGVHSNTVRNRCITFGIERRDKCEHFKGVPKSAAQKRKMSKARESYWRKHSDRDTFKLKISKSKAKDRLTHGYRRVYVLGQGRIREHILIAEQIMGRKLYPDEQVHHIDGNKLNNSPDNLAVLTNNQHQRLHNALRPRGKDGRFLKESNQ